MGWLNIFVYLVVIFLDYNNHAWCKDMDCSGPCLAVTNNLLVGKSDDENNWLLLGQYDLVDTYTKEFNDNKILAVRGESVFDMHISMVLSPFLNASANPLWVDMLTTHIEYPMQGIDDIDTAIVYQKYNFPWPISDRDFVLRRQIRRNPVLRQVDVFYDSVMDERLPEVEGIIRGYTIATYWGFQAVDSAALSEPSHLVGVDSNGNSGLPKVSDDGTNTGEKKVRTRVEVATAVDLKGALPTWLVNQLQKQWPSKSINSLRWLASAYRKLNRDPVTWLVNW